MYQTQSICSIETAINYQLVTRLIMITLMDQHTAVHSGATLSTSLAPSTSYCVMPGSLPSFKLDYHMQTLQFAALI